MLGLLVAALAALAAPPADPSHFPASFGLTTADHVRPIGVRVTADQHRGKKCVRVVGVPDFNGDQMALLEGTAFESGAIEADVAGQPVPGASAGARGFVGIAFHASGDGRTFECFYLRPTNGRADDQVRRNHSVQYISIPGFSFEDSRKEAPERYESYVDLVPGEWTHLRIEVEGQKARLFVHKAKQPTLIVNDLKIRNAAGAVALWIGDETEAWFRDVAVQGARKPD